MRSKANRFLLAATIAAIMLFISGCDPYSYRHPGTDPNEVWISQSPPMSFSWDEENPGHRGDLVIGENTIPIGVGFRSNTMAVFRLDSGDENTGYRAFFGGTCEFGQDQLIVTVTFDNGDCFGGTLPTITFERYVKQEDGSLRQGDGVSAGSSPTQAAVE